MSGHKLVGNVASGKQLIERYPGPQHLEPLWNTPEKSSSDTWRKKFRESARPSSPGRTGSPVFKFSCLWLRHWAAADDSWGLPFLHFILINTQPWSGSGTGFFQMEFWYVHLGFAFSSFRLAKCSALECTGMGICQMEFWQVHFSRKACLGTLATYTISLLPITCTAAWGGWATSRRTKDPESLQGKQANERSMQHHRSGGYPLFIFCLNWPHVEQDNWLLFL